MSIFRAEVIDTGIGVDRGWLHYPPTSDPRYCRMKPPRFDTSGHPVERSFFHVLLFFNIAGVSPMRCIGRMERFHPVGSGLKGLP